MVDLEGENRQWYLADKEKKQLLIKNGGNIY